MAELAGCHVEVVHDSDVLLHLGGVGCLLRYVTPGVTAKRRITISAASLPVLVAS